MQINPHPRTCPKGLCSRTYLTCFLYSVTKNFTVTINILNLDSWINCLFPVVSHLRWIFFIFISSCLKFLLGWSCQSECITDYISALTSVALIHRIYAVDKITHLHICNKNPALECLFESFLRLPVSYTLLSLLSFLPLSSALWFSCHVPFVKKALPALCLHSFLL